MKLELLDTKKVKPITFHSIRSYGAGIYAIEICNKLIKSHNEGNLLISDGGILVEPKFEMNFHVGGIGLSSLVFRESALCVKTIVGGKSKGSGIYCTKDSIRSFFSGWRVIEVAKSTKAISI